MGKIQKSTSKIINYFEDFVRKERTIEYITKIRKELHIPKDGIEYTKEDEEALTDKASILPDLYIPDDLVKITKMSRGKLSFGLYFSAINFVSMNGEINYSLAVLLRFYIIFNKTISIPLYDKVRDNDLLRLSHVSDDFLMYDEEDFNSLKEMYKYAEILNKSYPIVLYINPNATYNDVSKFLSLNWSRIENERKTFRGHKMLKVRLKRNLKLNDFIFEHRHLPLKEIVRLVNKTFGGGADQGNVGKIIAIETKKRKLTVDS